MYRIALLLLIHLKLSLDVEEYNIEEIRVTLRGILYTLELGVYRHTEIGISTCAVGSELQSDGVGRFFPHHGSSENHLPKSATFIEKTHRY